MSLLTCLLITSVLSTPVNAQTEDNIEKLVKNNSIEVCECFKKVDYIDDFSDFDIKFDQCLQASTNDSALKQDEHIFEQYTHSMHEHQMQSCDVYAARVDYVLQRPEPKLSDPIYNNQDQYKEIAESIVGEYSMSFGNPSPEGGSSLALLDNQRYVMVGFGVVLVGDWRIVKGKYLHLIPHRTEYPFYVFGRHNTELKDKTKIRFKGSGFSESTLIRYGEISQDTPILMPILHIDDQYPYDAKIPHIPRALSLAYNSDYENNDDEAIDIYTFDNDEELNDLYVLEFNKLARREVMKAIIGDDELTFDQGTTTKRPLPRATSENAEFYKEISDIKPFPKTLYYNLAGRSFDSRDIKQYNYTFDDNLKAYVANIKCHEDCPAADDYDNTDIFYEYKSLEDITVQQSKFKIANTFAVPRD
ncbi:hypothetical protein [Psychrobacter fjordensis]|uniref:hypothetical protein n=1 Tax=Psychrobacter fjordensis TaxID=664424 RepID=UPI0019182FF4|nr:hypothetical protein [Psychrobacter fjordensis]